MKRKLFHAQEGDDSPNVDDRYYCCCTGCPYEAMVCVAMTVRNSARTKTVQIVVCKFCFIANAFLKVNVDSVPYKLFPAHNYREHKLVHH